MDPSINNSVGSSASNVYEQEVVNGMNAAYAPSGITVSNDMSSITPGTLMAYCDSNLDSLQTQMSTIFVEQQTSNAEESQLGQLASQIQGNQAAGLNGTQACISLEQSIENLYNEIKQADPNSPVLAQLATLHDNVMATGSGPYTDPTTGQQQGYIGPGTYGYATGTTDQNSNISSDEMQSYVTAVQTMTSTLNSSSQTAMIQLQSLMSQQQTAIELTTNLVQSLGDTTQKVVENIGH